MRVSIAICTWNRASLLDATLAEMEKLAIPAGIEWELLVVNNNCTDDTSRVIAQRASRLPVRELHEPKQGLSNARNRALDAANGDIVLWTDDDALVDADWLTAYVSAARANPDAIFFGGPVDPWFAVTPPAWLKDNFSVFSGAYAVRRMPPGTTVLRNRKALPFGANFAVRRAGSAGLRFDPDLGRKGENLIGGEEVSFLGRLLDEGHFGVWVETARVRHHIAADRLNRRYLWDFYYGKGQSRIKMNRDPDVDSPGQLRRKYWKTKVKTWANEFRQGERWARALKASAITLGMMDELRRGDRSNAASGR